VIKKIVSGDGEWFLLLSPKERKNLSPGMAAALHACQVDINAQILKRAREFIEHYERTGRGQGAVEVIYEATDDLSAVTMTLRYAGGLVLVATAPITIPDQVH